MFCVLARIISSQVVHSMSDNENIFESDEDPANAAIPQPTAKRRQRRQHVGKAGSVGNAFVVAMVADAEPSKRKRGMLF